MVSIVAVLLKRIYKTQKINILCSNLTFKRDVNSKIDGIALAHKEVLLITMQVHSWAFNYDVQAKDWLSFWCYF